MAKFLFLFEAGQHDNSEHWLSAYKQGRLYVFGFGLWLCDRGLEIP